MTELEDDGLQPMHVMALHRYWVWADFHRKIMLEQGRPVEGETPLEVAGRQFDGLVALGFFYASLYVVVEGWRELGVADPEIDGLLVSDNTDLLRRFRNGIYHFQHDPADHRFLGFLDEAEQPVAWMKSLHSGFARWFQEWGERTIGFGPRQIAEWMAAERESLEESDERR